MATKLTFCMKCGQSWTPDSKPKCVCSASAGSGSCDSTSSKTPPNLPSFDGLKDGEGGQSVKKKNHYRGQFTSWKPTCLVSASKHTDYLDAMDKHESGDKPMTFNEYADLKTAIAVNAVIDDICHI